MYTLLTLGSQVLLCAFAAYFVWAAAAHSELAHGCYLKSEMLSLKLRGERDRVTVLERELEALRRELRKLSGKFYASQRTADDEETDEAPRYYTGTGIPASVLASRYTNLPPCENWSAAQQLGPDSQAADCVCQFCVEKRADRARLRSELVPKSVQGQAELARLNAGKP